MFEYLMPSLVLREPANSALGRAIRTAVAEQRFEARGKGTPWASRIGDRRTGPHPRLPVRPAGRADAGAGAAGRRRARAGAVCGRDGRDRGAGARRVQPAGLRTAGRARRVRLHRGRRLHAAAADRRRGIHAGADLHGPPPGDGIRRADQPAGRRRAAPLARSRSRRGSSSRRTSPWTPRRSTGPTTEAP